MIFPRLRVFVSSKMQELAPERQAVKAALGELIVDAWVFEHDAGARPVSIEKVFLEEVAYIRKLEPHLRFEPPGRRLDRPSGRPTGSRRQRATPVNHVRYSARAVSK